VVFLLAALILALGILMASQCPDGHSWFFYLLPVLALAGTVMYFMSQCPDGHSWFFYRKRRKLRKWYMSRCLNALKGIRGFSTLYSGEAIL
jgi:hypothetical protein